MADPDLQMGGRGGHPDPEIRGGGSPKKLFSALWASVWSKNKGRGGGVGPSPGSTTELAASSLDFEQSLFCSKICEQGQYVRVRHTIC